MTQESWDRLRMRVAGKFRTQLSRIPDAPNSDDLIHEAIEDLINDKRHCPLDMISLPVCLFNIVRSKVSNIQKKWNHCREKENFQIIDSEEFDIPTNSLGHYIDSSVSHLSKAGDVLIEEISESEVPSLRERILFWIKDDPLLVRIVEYQLTSGGDIKPRRIAEELKISIKDIYNANRRLKIRLTPLLENIK